MNNLLEIKREKFICMVCDKPRARFVCGRCHAVDYCSRECQVKDVKRHKMRCAPAVMKAMDRRTRGIFATKDFKKGDLIFKVEADMCVKEGGNIINPAMNDVVSLKKRDISADMQFHYMKQGDGGNRLNSWSFSTLTHGKFCLAPLLGQFRHQCSSNATTNVVAGNLFLREVRAIKDIKKGDEVTLNYLFTFPISIGDSKERKIYKYLPSEVRKTILSVWDAPCEECNPCSKGEEDLKMNELRNLKERINNVVNSSDSCVSCGDRDWAVTCSKYQREFVDKVRDTYLAPYLLPLECPILIYYCHFGGDTKGAALGMKLWKEVLEQRNVELFQRQYEKMPKILKKIDVSDGCCQTRIFQAFIDDVQNNIF